jgi:hypothetical protein
MSILIILLGCHITNLLNNRIETAVNFALNERNNGIDWFLSGGIKNPMESTVSEAHKMSDLISNSEVFVYGNTPEKWNYIYDTISSNTAENFIMAKRMIEENPDKYSDVYVVTSDFHYNRANKIADKIISSNNFKWILGDKELHDSRYWETIHIKNVDADVNKALKK